MATNPNPAHITAEYWWFIEALEALEAADTVFAGAWGRDKPGGHCDAWYLWNRKVGSTFPWRNDYTIRHPDDQVLGTPLEQFGAATDWTFLSAQRGDRTNIRKYGGRVRKAFLDRDPRLNGWHEVLIQADADAPADGYNFRSWTERTPDITHDWHGHFTCSRKYLRTLQVFQAMISILKGETLAQWQARNGDDMLVIWQLPNGWVGCSNGPTRFGYAAEADLKEAMLAFGVTTLRKIAPEQLGAYGTDVTGIGGGQLVLTDEQIIAIGLRIIDAVPTADEIADAVADEEAARMKE